MLPPAPSASLELDGMTQVAGSFVDEELRWRHCDLLFATRSRGRDERALRARPLTAPARVTLLLLGRTAANPGLVRELAGWVTDLRAVLDRPRGTELFRALVTYVETAGEAQPEELRHLMQQVGPDAEEACMTTADMLRAEGEARGRAEGEARGRAEALLQLLALRFGPVPEDAETTIRTASTDRIEGWTTRVLTAESLDDVLR